MNGFDEGPPTNPDVALVGPKLLACGLSRLASARVDYAHSKREDRERLRAPQALGNTPPPPKDNAIVKSSALARAHEQPSARGPRAAITGHLPVLGRGSDSKTFPPREGWVGKS